MTYNEKKSLYESIMWEAAKTVKRMINEVDNNTVKTTINLRDGDNPSNSAQIELNAISMEKLYELVYSIVQASVTDMNQSFWKISITDKDFRVRMKEYIKPAMPDKKKDDAIDDTIEKIYATCFKGKKNAKEIASSIKNNVQDFLNSLDSVNDKDIQTDNKFKSLLSKNDALKQAYANVRDMVSRRNFDVEWAKSIEPNPRFDENQLLMYYVSALKIYNKKFPKSLKEVVEIGIFKNYFLKFIENKYNINELFDKIKL